MKKLLLTIAAVVGTFAAGSGIAWADEALITYQNATTSSVGNARIATFTNGFKFVNYKSKGMDSASAAKFKISKSDGTTTTANGFKMSKDIQYSLVYPEGAIVSKLTLYSFVNGDTEGCYWKQVGNKSYSNVTDASADGFEISCTSTAFKADQTKANVVSISEGIPNDSIVFIPAESQIGCAVVVEYTLKETKVANPTISISELDGSSRTYTATISTTTENATLYYAFDNTEETVWQEYIAPVSVTPGNTIYAKGTAADLNPSGIVSAKTEALAETTEGLSEVAGVASSSNTALEGTSFVIGGTYNAGAGSNVKDFANFSSYTKIRTNRTAGDHVGFRIQIKEGFIITGVKINGYANSGKDTNNNNNTVYSDIVIDGVYVDGSSENQIETSATFPKLEDKKTATWSIDGLNATSTIDFNCTSENTAVNQLVAQLTISYKFTETAPEKVATVTFSTVPFATLYLAQDVAIPSGVTVYTGELSESGNYFNLTPVTSDVIPAETGVIVEGITGASADFYTTTRANFTKFTSVLSGSVDEKEVSDVYVLSYNTGKEDVGFYKFSGTLPANKAYLVVAAAEAPAFRFNFGAETEEVGNVTGINAVTIENRTDNVIYDLRGRRVLSLDRPGLYIVNGKKVAIK